MEKGKKFYLKPQMGIMNVQTEGVIAASGDIIIVKDLCDANYLFSNINSCDEGVNKCRMKKDIQNCNIKQYEGPYRTCHKIKSQVYHVELFVTDGNYHIYPCNCE